MANRTVLVYQGSTLRFYLAATLIVAVAALGVAILIASLADVEFTRQQLVTLTAGGATNDAELLRRADRLVLPSLIRFGLMVAAIVAFAAWLSRVITNVPTLGGGLPSTTPTRAFIYPLIPLWNLIKVPGMVQDALYRLEPQAGGFFMVLLAWFGLVGSWIVSLLGGWVIAFTMTRDVLAAAAIRSPDLALAALLRAFDQSVLLEVVTSLMVAAGAIVLVLVMARIERRARTRDAEIRALAAGTLAVAAEAGLSGEIITER